MIRRRAVSGFTLLEILVVVTLVAGIAAFVLPALVGDNPAKEREKKAEEIARLMVLASDYSLFRGQLVAMQLNNDKITPLVFDLEEKDFIEAPEQGLPPVTIEEPLTLEWQLDPDPSRETSLADAALAQRNSADDGNTPTPESMQRAGDNDPQVFFYPSGEATPVVFLIHHPDLPADRRLQLDAMGRVADPDQVEEEGDDEDAR